MTPIPSIVQSIEKKELEPSRALKQPIDDHLICLVCQYVCWNPECCDRCDTMFCHDCISEWLTKKNTCPKCIGTYEKRDHVTRYELNKLSDLKFQCHKCPDVFAYSEADKHIEQKHKKEDLYACPFNCGVTDLKEVLGVKNHLQKCKELPVLCENCGLSVVATKKAKHNCVSELKAKLETVIAS